MRWHPNTRHSNSLFVYIPSCLLMSPIKSGYTSVVDDSAWRADIQSGRVFAMLQPFLHTTVGISGAIQWHIGAILSNASSALISAEVTYCCLKCNRSFLMASAVEMWTYVQVKVAIQGSYPNVPVHEKMASLWLVVSYCNTVCNNICNWTSTYLFRVPPIVGKEWAS